MLCRTIVGRQATRSMCLVRRVQSKWNTRIDTVSRHAQQIAKHYGSRAEAIVPITFYENQKEESQEKENQEKRTRQDGDEDKSEKELALTADV